MKNSKYDKDFRAIMEATMELYYESDEETLDVYMDDIELDKLIDMTIKYVLDEYDPDTLEEDNDDDDIVDKVYEAVKDKIKKTPSATKDVTKPTKKPMSGLKSKIKTGVSKAKKFRKELKHAGSKGQTGLKKKSFASRVKSAAKAAGITKDKPAKTKTTLKRKIQKGAKAVKTGIKKAKTHGIKKGFKAGKRSQRASTAHDVRKAKAGAKKPATGKKPPTGTGTGSTTKPAGQPTGKAFKAKYISAVLFTKSSRFIVRGLLFTKDNSSSLFPISLK